MSLTIGTDFEDELRRKRLGENGYGQYGNDYGNNNVVVQPDVGQTGSADAFNAKYGVTSVFGISEDNPAASGRERFNVAGANAGTAGGADLVKDTTVTPTNTSIWTQGDFNNPNIQPGGPNSVSGANVVTPTAIQQPSGTDRNNPEYGIGKNEGEGTEPEKPKFGAGDIFALTGGLDISSSFAPKPTGEATLSTVTPEDEAEKPEGAGESPAEVPEEPEDKVEEPADDVKEPEKAEEDTEAEIIKQQEEDAAKKAEEEAARKAAEEREKEQRAA